jgi:pyrroloquinoline quinone biosynthesis protein B
LTDAVPSSTERADGSTTGPVVRVLGSVQDGGLPHAGCYCDTCNLARNDPAHRRWVASLGVIIPSDGRRFLIDATPDVRPQLDALRGDGPDTETRSRRRPVDGIFLTHAHIGHYLGLAFFGYEAMHTSQVPVYCSPELAGFLASNAPWDQLVRLEEITLHEVSDHETLRLHESLGVTAIPVPHRDEYADTVGFILRGPKRSLLYVPDTDAWAAWDPPLTEVLDGVDIAILDGTFFSAGELPGRDMASIGHPLIERSLDLLGPWVESGKLEVYFTHLNHSNPALDPESEAAARIRGRGFGVVRAGQEFPL